jgi:hypothetical protein
MILSEFLGTAHNGSPDEVAIKPVYRGYKRQCAPAPKENQDPSDDNDENVQAPHRITRARNCRGYRLADEYLGHGGR